MHSETLVRLTLDVASLGLNVDIDVDRDANPELADAILSQLPLSSHMGHVVISGEGIWMPTRLVYLGEPRMIQRAMGSVYFNAPGQSICITYGVITESAVVNQFGRVTEKSFDQLRALGSAVWRHTVESPQRVPVVGTLARAA